MGVEQLFSDGEQAADVTTYDFLCGGESNSADSPLSKFTGLRRDNSIGNNTAIITSWLHAMLLL